MFGYVLLKYVVFITCFRVKHLSDIDHFLHLTGLFYCNFTMKFLEYTPLER